jgi:hypothetical protein
MMKRRPSAISIKRKNPQPGEDEACPTALRMTLAASPGGAFEIAATKVAVGLHVADGGFDGGTASRFAFDAAGHAALLA